MTAEREAIIQFSAGWSERSERNPMSAKEKNFNE